MEQRDALTVYDLSGEGREDAAVLAAEEVEGSTEPGRVPEVDSSVHGAALESVKIEDLEEPSPEPEEVTAGSVENEGHCEVIKNPVATNFVSGAKVAIAHASPPDSYRRQPSRSRKQHSPRRFIETRSALDDATPSSCVNDAPASSSSKCQPSRARKQPRPEHFIPEEAKATASTKARRSSIVLGRFLSSQVLHGSSTETSSEQAGARVRGAGPAISRLGPASPSAAAAKGNPRGEPNGSARIYVVLAILGAALALSVVSCLLFYVVGRRSGGEPGPPPGEKRDE